MRTARNVLVRTPKKDHVYRNAELFPANLLAQAGIKLFPHDLILLDDKVIAHDQPLPSGLDVVLEYIPAKRIDLYTNGKLFTSIFTQAVSYQEALEEAQFQINPLDDFEPELDTPLQAINRLEIFPSRQLCIQTSAQTVCGLSSARTVSQALLDLDLSPQLLDFTGQRVKA